MTLLVKLLVVAQTSQQIINKQMKTTSFISGNVNNSPVRVVFFSNEDLFIKIFKKQYCD